MDINYANLQLQYQKYKTDIDANIQVVLNKSNYIMGGEFHNLERELGKFTTPFTFNINADLIEAAITDRTKAIMPVSLYGQPADMDAIQAIVK